MKKLLQGTFGVVKIGVGILLLLGVMLWQSTNLRIFKSSLAGLIHGETGIDVDMPGDLQLTFFPNLGLQLRQLSVNNAASFSEKAFVKLDKLELGTKLLPLLSGRIELDTIHLDGMNLYLSKNEQGQANWQELIRSNDAGAKPLMPKIMGILQAFEGEGLQLKHGYLRYVDQSSQRRFELKEVNVHIARLQLGQKIPMALDFILHQTNPELVQRVQIHFDVEFNASQNIVQIKHFQLSSDAPSKSALKTQLAIADVEFQLDKQTLLISGIHLLNGALNVHSELRGQFQQENFKLQGPIKLPAFNLKQWFSEWSIDLPGMQDKAALTKVSAESELTVTQHSVQLASLLMMIDQTTLKGALALNSFTNPQLNFDLLVDKVVLENYLAPKSPQLPTDSALTSETLAVRVGKLNLPFALLKAFQGNGQLKIQQMFLNDVSMQDIVFELHQ